MISKLTKEQVEKLVSSSIEEISNILKNEGVQLSDEDLSSINGGFGGWLADLAGKYDIPKEKISTAMRYWGANPDVGKEAVQAIAGGRPRDIV